MRDEEENRLRGRLFQRLQQRIGARIVEIIRGIHNHHAPAAESGGFREKLQRIARVLNADLGTEALVLRS